MPKEDIECKVTTENRANLSWKERGQTSIS